MTMQELKSDCALLDLAQDHIKDEETVHLTARCLRRDAQLISSQNISSGYLSPTTNDTFVDSNGAMCYGKEIGK
jgi:hypothetical protein